MNPTISRSSVTKSPSRGTLSCSVKNATDCTSELGAPVIFASPFAIGGCQDAVLVAGLHAPFPEDPNRGRYGRDLRGGPSSTCSVLNGGVSRIRAGQPAELIARKIPSTASMRYDPGANQLMIPMNPNNGLAFVRLE
jgi:hypothetical protein